MIVSDATALIILMDLERTELLSNIFETIYIPDGVYREISAKGAITLPSFIKKRDIEENSDLTLLMKLLDRGESEAILLAKQMQLGLIIDEKKGRKIAQNYSLKIIGLLGVVFLNIKKGYLTEKEAKLFLEDAMTHGYRISTHLIQQMFESLS